MNNHYVVPQFSYLWWAGFAFSALFIFLSLYTGKKLKPEGQKRLGHLFGLLFLLMVFLMHIYEWLSGSWDLQKSLPLQLCAMSAILSGLVFFWPSQRAFELLVYWGIPGAFHSILTPEMSHGHSDFIILEYYISHAGILLSALYLPLIMGRNLRNGSWLGSFYFTLAAVLITGIFNYFLNANYMYLCQRPLADNAMIIGEWPWYLFILFFVVIVHFFIVYWLFKKLGWVVKTAGPKA
jgi:hypothetical integral membrane protein (TIGR02206 family)